MSTAWIDPLTNIIRPRGVVLRRDLKSLLLLGPWPGDLVQGFVHELTHHSCFHSELGAALALLRFRALRRLTTGENEPGEEDALFDDMITVDAVVRLLRPLSEGLALFAEYDMLPGESSIASTSMGWAALALFGASEYPRLDISSQAQELASRLIDLRLSRSSLDRKMSFLVRAASDLDEAYFQGYMMVKRIYADLRRVVPAFRDTDLFMSYMISFFFRDHGMVAILLRKYDNPYQRLTAAIERFGERFHQLYSADLRLEVATFEQRVAKRERASHEFDLPGLQITAQESLEGRRSLESLIAVTLNPPSALSVWTSRRSLAHVALEKASVQVKNGMMSVWPMPRDHEWPLVAGTALETALDTAGPVDGWVSFVLQPQTVSYAGVVGVGDAVVGLVDPSRRLAGTEFEMLICHPRCAPPVIERERLAVDAWVDGYFDNAPAPLKRCIETVRSTVRDSLQRVSDAFLNRWGAAVELSTRLKSGDRILDLLSGDADAFRSFVALGILQSEDALLPSVAATALQQGWDFGQALRVAASVQQESGFRSFWNDAGVFRWLL